MSRQMERAREILAAYDGPKIRVMEVCGTHTHEIFRLGIRSILPRAFEVISGPGCPVCVTPASYIEEAVWLANQDVVIATFGDLVRVPGGGGSLADARAKGGKIQVVYAPEDALQYAIDHPEEEVVFLSVGFETTTPASCLALKKAAEENVKNFSLLTANKTMPGAYQAMAHSADVFLYPGHVHAITGTGLCESLAKEKGVSGVIAGFRADELLTAFAVIAKNYPLGEPFFVNAYPRVVTTEGSPAAVRLIEEWMEPCDSEWRGIGVIKDSGLRLKKDKDRFDARIRFGIPQMEGKTPGGCRCGEVLQGSVKPTGCPLFGKVCSPDHPVGACMVSGEGACSAYYQYGGYINDER